MEGVGGWVIKSYLTNALELNAVQQHFRGMVCQNYGSEVFAGGLVQSVDDR